MPRIIATVTDDMDKALTQIQEATQTPVAVLVREALNEYLEKRGQKVDTRVRWGGKREPRKAKTIERAAS